MSVPEPEHQHHERIVKAVVFVPELGAKIEAPPATQDDPLGALWNGRLPRRRRLGHRALGDRPRVPRRHCYGGGGAGHCV